MTTAQAKENEQVYDLVDRAWTVLDAVCDPEIPVLSIREMGMLRAIHPTENGVSVELTPTYSGCPAIEQIEADVRSALAAAHIAATVQTRLAPAWTTDWMSAAARAKLRAYGIAPPERCEAHAAKPIADTSALGGTANAECNGATPSSGAAGVQLETQANAQVENATKIRANNLYPIRISRQKTFQNPACPQCASHNTTEVSHFASTACKALYRCLDCLEPFDYFKPH